VPRKLSIFLNAAMDAGLGSCLAAMRADVERAIADDPADDLRRLTRLQGQLARLRNPDLDLVARLVGVLCAKTRRAWPSSRRSPGICNLVSRSWPAWRLARGPEPKRSCGVLPG